jgi:hypothetical protein
VPTADPLKIAFLLFQHVDQLDVTGPFEVLAQLKNAQVLLVAHDRSSVLDMYAPEPPFAGGTLETTPLDIRTQVEDAIKPLCDRRRETAARIRARLAIP